MSYKEKLENIRNRLFNLSKEKRNLPSERQNSTDLEELSSLDTGLDSLLASQNSLIDEPINFAENIINLIILLDISSSMNGTEEDIKEGLKHLINNHKNDTILFNLIVFDENRDVLIKDTYIKNVSIPNISVGWNTNLNGSLYYSLNEKCKGGFNFLVVISDGEDNVNEICASQVKSLMNKLKSSYNNFYFLGEPNEFQTPEEVYNSAYSLGFEEDNISIFTRKKNGNRLNFEVVSDMLEDLLRNGSISKDWASPIKKHYLLLEGKRW